MMKMKLLGPATVISAAALATPVMAQEATQEPGVIGFNYPNSHYLRGGYGVRTPDMAERRGYVRTYGPYGYGYAPPPYGSFSYYDPEW
ncbi:hypothetical protein JQ628_13265 [Bradyrhizobium lablabi]|uniref:hypothetical protein n=1 Tax=Bradyrhizobium lablabi TaxID=722472 RepID=UPI001BA6D77C|nr:hypothetical protein [Bradyrhizobium lablabi]MBR1122490.1 hypothetical protein [Bradyrhizobium lablabi]